MQDGRYRVYCACINAKKGCKAKMRVTSASKSAKHKIVDRELVGEHNHPPDNDYNISSDSEDSMKENEDSDNDSEAMDHDPPPSAPSKLKKVLILI